MNSDRRTILSLVALGRITPREAERLLAVWPDEEEFMLRLAVALAVVWMVLPHLVEFLHAASRGLLALLAGIPVVTHHALSWVALWWGGLS
jgi:hypothetical protein